MQIDHFFKEEAIAHLNVILSCSESIDETKEMGKTILRSIKDKLDKTNFSDQFPDDETSFEQIFQNPSLNIVDDLNQAIKILESVVENLHK